MLRKRPMRRAARFLLALVAGLAVLTLVGYFALTRTIRDWFESDLALRSQLAVAAARRTLADNWLGDQEKLAETLADIANDERILGAAACSPDGTMLAATDAYPHRFSCAWLFNHMRADGRPEAPIWSSTAKLTSGR